MRISNSLILGSDRSLYRGELPATNWHSHAAPALLIGLSGRFALHFTQGRTESCYSAWIDSGVEHVFDSLGEQVATMYLEPDAVDTRRWKAHFANHGGIVLDPCILVQGRSSIGRAEGVLAGLRQKSRGNVRRLSRSNRAFRDVLVHDSNNAGRNLTLRASRRFGRRCKCRCGCGGGCW